MNEDLHLIYIDYIGENSDGLFEYDFFFSENIETAWGNDWNEQCPSACNKEEMIPDSSVFDKVERFVLSNDIYLVQDNSCFSLQDCIDGIISMAWYEDEKSHLVPIKFGEKYEDVITKIKILQVNG